MENKPTNVSLVLAGYKTWWPPTKYVCVCCVCGGCIVCRWGIPFCIWARCPSPRSKLREATVQSGCWDWLKESIHMRNCPVGCLWSMLRQLTPSSLEPCEDSRLLEVITFPKGTQEYRFTIGPYHLGGGTPAGVWFFILQHNILYLLNKMW